MANRRQFLKASLATASLATVASVGGPALAAKLGAPNNRLKLEAALFEPGRAHSAGFGAAARRLGLPTLDVVHDITPVWLRLVQLWRNTPAAIVGLTSRTPLLLLEQSARDYGLRVVWRGEHRLAELGMIAHSLEGPEGMLRAFGRGVAHGADYDVCIAHVLSSGSMVFGRGQEARLETVTTVNGSTDAAPLYSWIIARRNHAFERGATA